MASNDAPDQFAVAIRHPSAMRQQFTRVRIDQHQALHRRIEARQLADPGEHRLARGGSRANDRRIYLVVVDQRL